MTPVSSVEAGDPLQGARRTDGEARRLTPRRRDARRRLHCIAGHLEGLAGLVEADKVRVVPDQIRAVRRALNRVTLLVLEEHLEAIAVWSPEWDDERTRRAVRETWAALFGVPATGEGERSQTFPLECRKEDGCASV